MSRAKEIVRGLRVLSLTDCPSCFQIQERTNVLHHFLFSGHHVILSSEQQTNRQSCSSEHFTCVVFCVSQLQFQFALRQLHLFQEQHKSKIRCSVKRVVQHAMNLWSFVFQANKSDYESCVTAARDAWQVWADVSANLQGNLLTKLSCWNELVLCTG